MTKNIPENKADEKLTGEPYAAEQTANQSEQIITPSGNTEEMVKALTMMFQTYGNQMSLQTADTPSGGSRTKAIESLKDEIDKRLTGGEIPTPRGSNKIIPISVPFPECSDVLLSLIQSSKNDEITEYFKDYFKFGGDSVIPFETLNRMDFLDKQLLECAGKSFPNARTPQFPPIWCLPPSCVRLDGNRNLKDKKTEKGIRRLFIADLVWLFYFDRLGIFQILGKILDDFAIKGQLPISNGSIFNRGKDDLIALVLEAMVRKTKIGLSSTVRDRNISYRRGLGWISEEGRSLGLDTVINQAFTNLFHKFIQTSLEFYKDKRLATAIQGLNSGISKTSVATLISIKDTIGLLKKAFDNFDYGRNYSHTLHGIVWVIAAMTLIREMRTTLGIPPEYDKPYEFIPAAYDLLVNPGKTKSSESNRYNLHRDCATNARDILLDLEVVNQEEFKSDGELEVWIDLIEGKVEGYRTAYRNLTGIDLGDAGTPKIEQQVG